MSTTKIIKGWVSPGQARRSSDGYDGGIVRLNVYGPDEPNEGCDIYDYDEPATLIIGPGKLWTEDEVQAALSSKDAEIEALRNPWISVKDRLPKPHTLVVLLNEDRRWVAPDDMVANVHAIGRLNSIHGQTYWSIPGERGSDISAYTHWAPLQPPTQP